jgi:TPP-dependent pyruvate/acetoin dehydrogenase alpha subunit
VEQDDRMPSPDDALAMLHQMKLIRAVEEHLSEDSRRGQLAGAVHLYIGQEAVAVGVCARLRLSDKITSTHRGHGHFLAKGGSPASMLAEIYAKDSGICRGMGGSMHVADLSKGILGANGIVAGGMAIAAGAALAAQMAGQGDVAVCFFGDGAANEGVLMETLNIATLWKLPMIFVCENNGFSEFSPSVTVTAGRIRDRAAAFCIPCHEVDGNDVIAVWRACGAAVDVARAGDGPAFIEAHTYRIHGHFEAEASILKTAYREEAEISVWRDRDPIVSFQQRLLDLGVLSAGRLASLDTLVREELHAAAMAASEAPPARTDLAPSLMFADNGV